MTSHYTFLTICVVTFQRGRRVPIDDSYSNPSEIQAMALAVALVSFIIVGTASCRVHSLSQLEHMALNDTQRCPRIDRTLTARHIVSKTARRPLMTRAFLRRSPMSGDRFWSSFNRKPPDLISCIAVVQHKAWELPMVGV